MIKLHYCAGVIVFEAISDVPAFGRMVDANTVFEAAHGQRKYVWEEAHTAQFTRSRIRDVVVRCLHRDASKRPNAAQILQAVDRLGNSTTTSSKHENTLDAVSNLM